MPDSQDPKQVNHDLRNAQFGGGFINAETVNAGRIGGDIWNIFFGQQTTPVGNTARPKNEHILLAAVKQEVNARLRQSLHNAVLINLGKESQPQQVKRPWDAEIKIGLKPTVPILETTTVLEVFDSPEIAGKLLILGAPGSGKTTTQLELAQALVSRAEEQPDYPVPVLFNLSSWKDDRHSLCDWLVAELKSKYGVSAKLGKEWIDSQKLLLLLDGLDELESVWQESSIIAINEFIQGECRPEFIVVCSRTEEYTSYKTRLQLNGTVCLQPLTTNQIYTYLVEVNHADLHVLISKQPDLLELIKLPLLLSIFVLAYQEIFINSWENMTEDRWNSMTAETWDQMQSVDSFNLQYLLMSYICRMLTRDIDSKVYTNQKLPTNQQTRLWLTWLAQQLDRKAQTEFLSESIQPSCLNKNIQKWVYRIIFMLNIWLTSGIIGFVFGSISFGFFKGIALGSFFAFIVTFNLISSSCSNFIFTRNNSNTYNLGKFRRKVLNYSSVLLRDNFRFNIDEPISPIGYIHWSFKNLFNILLINLGQGVLIYYFLISVFQQTMTSGLIFVCVFIIVNLLISGSGIFEKSDIENQTEFNQSVKQSIKFSGLVAVFTCFSFMILFWINRIWRTTTITELFLIFGLLVGVFRWQTTGGLFCIQHFTLRLILYCNGYIPWNYARFLDYCTERMLLQRVGGRYRFIHKLLQDHFAQMEFRRD
ncbi:NACHT domain-containing protein [Nostoc sp. FACHB-87]|uniref:NACHT domain-containing protein n=1 Tax=Nostocaceae TaxID=1162 RepID=UPI0016868BA3|nr:MULTISPECIES: NACHT domain-containing protein [Nostocaceae]MBD2459079.1 NACHT domain-containing protein [Nostoc sp. FACHB-87]MBD2480107.1 NACHT domain-containing protein [Anabaena sp. FACHB-83]